SWPGHVAPSCDPSVQVNREWAHLEEEPPAATARNGELPSAIDGVLAKALAKSPDDRYSSCDAFTRDAQQALGLNRPRDSRRLRTLLVLAGVAVAAAVAFAFLRGHGAAAAPEVRQNSLLRIEPSDGRVTWRKAFPRSVLLDSVATGAGAVWLIDSGHGVLYRVDPRRRRISGHVHVGTNSGRPWVAFGDVWVALDGDTVKGVLVD